ncbi:MAG: outer membrane beta-barrel protein [Bacteroidota bacterium]|nr:outer membrane beta-barrel protein [Bacteroidota bacterium]
MITKFFPSIIQILFSFFVFAFAPNKLFAQQKEITFNVVNKQAHPVPYATIKILPEHDSIHFLEKVTDSLGKTVINLMQDHRYTVLITAVNYNFLRQGIALMNDKSTFIFTLENRATTLNAVVVQSKKPMMRQEDDKTIVDPENLAAGSTSGYEVLEKIPGLFMDQDGNIYLNSTTPAAIYINGREQKMSTDDIASLLKSLPPNSIASIEILRTPSAKYDASATGGIVNVVLRKGIKIGLTGSINAGMQQGKYGTQFAGFNLNNNNGSLSDYLNVQITHKNTYDEIKTNRIFATDSMLSQDARTIYPGNNYYIGYGISYELNKKWEISYDGRVTLSDAQNQATNLSSISKISNGDLLVNNSADVSNKNNVFFLSQGITTKLSIDTLGSEWKNDFSYNFSPNKTLQNFTTNFTMPVTAIISGNGDLRTNLNFYSGESNLIWKLRKKITIETGIKTTITEFKNNTNYFRHEGTIHVADDERSSIFNYHEAINAAYIQVSKTISDITLKAGARMENTSMLGKQQIPDDTTFSLKRTDFFPYVFLSRPLMKVMGYELRGYLIYRRTIKRPGYDLLNPSQHYVDPYLFETGNPSLRPQFTQNYEMNISADEHPIFAFGINDTKDIFTNVVYQADSNRRVAYRTYDNLGSNKETYFRIIGAIPPGKKLFIIGGAQYNYNFYQGLYEGEPLSFKRGSWSIFSYQTLKLSGSSQLTLYGFARFNGQQQFYELSPFGSLSLNINKQFLKKKLVITLSGTDLFYTNNNNFTLNQGSFSASGFRKSDTRRIGVNARYSFGIRKKEQNNLFNIASPDKSN